MFRLALTYGAVASSAASAYIGLDQGQAQIAGAVLLAALAFVAVRLSMGGVIPRPSRPSRASIRRAAVPIVAVCLVTTMILGGIGGEYAATGSASAEWADCDLTDPLLGGAYNTLTGADSGCRWESGDQTNVEGLSATDAYSSGLALKDSADSYVTTTDNFAEDTRTVAYSKAKIAMVQALNNGSSVSVAQQEMNRTVDDYYSRAQMSVIRDWNAKMEQIEYFQNTPVAMDANIQTEATTKTWDNLNYPKTTQFTLANGTQANVTVFQAKTGTAIGPVGDSSTNVEPARIRLKHPNTSDTAIILDTTDYGMINLHESPDSDFSKTDLLGQFGPQSQQVKDNLAPYSQTVYNQYQAGEIDDTDLARMDPAVIGNEASTDLESSGYYGHAAIMLASIGASGNLNASHTIDTASGTTLNGTLYYTGDDLPAAGWETGTTYNHSNYNGTAYMAVQKNNGNATIVDLENYGASFTIREATNTQTGESLNTTKTQTYTYNSTNATALADEIDRLRQLRESYKNQESGGGGGGFDFGGNSTAIAIAAGAAAVLLLSRQ
jgi:hypothetical protein